jgi:predicted nucleic acid-binding protein
MIVLDTGGLYTAIDASEALHSRAIETLASFPPPRVLSPFVLVELDYLIGTRVGHQAQMALLGEVARGAYQLDSFTADDVVLACRIMERYADHRIGLADASVVVLANRHRTLDLLCIDARHFRVLRGTAGKPFRLLPLDS